MFLLNKEKNTFFKHRIKTKKSRPYKNIDYPLITFYTLITYSIRVLSL